MNCCDLETQSRSQWYEWVKLNKYYHHAKFDICHVYSVRENRTVIFFFNIRTIGWPAGLTLINTYTHIFHESQHNTMWVDDRFATISLLSGYFDCFRFQNCSYRPKVDEVLKRFFAVLIPPPPSSASLSSTENLDQFCV